MILFWLLLAQDIIHETREWTPNNLQIDTINKQTNTQKSQDRNESTNAKEWTKCAPVILTIIKYNGR